MIRILTAHSLIPGELIEAESMGVKEGESNSTATITENMGNPARSTGTWIRDGDGRIWRIRSVEENPVTLIRTLQAEHIIQVLKDRIIPGEITAGDMGGSDTCTARQALTKILSYQSDWRLGDVEYDVNQPYAFNGEDLLSAIQTVTGTLADSWMEYDLTVYPFLLHIRKTVWTPTCEMRMSRNITSIRRTIDMSRMFTRFYPVGKDELRLSGAGYASRNENIYGIREKTGTDQSKENEAALRAWAEERLQRHARPDVTIQISGLELADATGEPLDRLTLGRVCRVPLPEFGTVIEERIISKNYPDIIGRPSEVTITLGNELEDVSTILKREVTGSGSTAARGGRYGAKIAKEDHAWFTDTEDHVSMTAEAIIGKSADGKVNWSRVADITVNGDGIFATVTETKNDMVAANTRIDQTEEHITLEAQKFADGQAALSARLTVEADRITAEVQNRQQQGTQLSSRITQTANAITAEVNRASAAEGQLSSRITVTADRIETKVSKNGVISSINQSAETIDINASRINLTGYVTASQLNSVDAKIDNLKSGVTTAAKLSATTLQANTSFNCFGHNLSLIQKTLDGTTYHFLGYYG